MTTLLDRVTNPQDKIGVVNNLFLTHCDHTEEEVTEEGLTVHRLTEEGLTEEEVTEGNNLSPTLPQISLPSIKLPTVPQQNISLPSIKLPNIPKQNIRDSSEVVTTPTTTPPTIQIATVAESTKQTSSTLTQAVAEQITKLSTIATTTKAISTTTVSTENKIKAVTTRTTRSLSPIPTKSTPAPATTTTAPSETIATPTLSTLVTNNVYFPGKNEKEGSENKVTEHQKLTLTTIEETFSESESVTKYQYSEYSTTMITTSPHPLCTNQLDLAMIAGIVVSSVLLTIATVATIVYIILRKKQSDTPTERQIFVTGYAWRKSFR